MDKNTDKTNYKVTVSSGLSAEEILAGYLKRNPEGMRGAIKGFLSDRCGQGGYIYGSAASLAEAAAVLLTYGFERIDNDSTDKKIAETELGLDLLQCNCSAGIKEASVCCTVYRTGDGEYKAVFTEGDFKIILDTGVGYKIEGKLKCGPEMLEGFSGEVTQYYDKLMQGRICRGSLHSPETIIIDNLQKITVMAERKLFKVYGHGEWPGYNGLELFEFDEMMTLDEAIQYSNHPDMLERLVRTRIPKYTRIDSACIRY